MMSNDFCFLSLLTGVHENFVSHEIERLGYILYSVKTAKETIGLFAILKLCFC